MTEGNPIDTKNKSRVGKIMRNGAFAALVLAPSIADAQTTRVPTRSFPSQQGQENGYGRGGGFNGGGQGGGFNGGFGNNYNPNRPPVQQRNGIDWNRVGQVFFEDLARQVAREVGSISFGGQNYMRGNDGSYRSGSGMILNDSGFYQAMSSRRIHIETSRTTRELIGTYAVRRAQAEIPAPVRVAALPKKVEQIPCVETPGTETSELVLSVEKVKNPMVRLGTRPSAERIEQALDEAHISKFIGQIKKSGRFANTAFDTEAFYSALAEGYREMRSESSTESTGTMRGLAMSTGGENAATDFELDTSKEKVGKTGIVEYKYRHKTKKYTDPKTGATYILNLNAFDECGNLTINDISIVKITKAETTCPPGSGEKVPANEFQVGMLQGILIDKPGPRPPANTESPGMPRPQQGDLMYVKSPINPVQIDATGHLLPQSADAQKRLLGMLQNLIQKTGYQGYVLIGGHDVNGYYAQTVTVNDIMHGRYQTHKLLEKIPDPAAGVEKDILTGEEFEGFVKNGVTIARANYVEGGSKNSEIIFTPAMQQYDRSGQANTPVRQR